MKRVVILGSTGSIGVSSCAVLANLKKLFIVEGLAAHSNIALLEQQIKEFNPKQIALFDAEKAKELQKRLPGRKILTGFEGLCELASMPDVDIVICAMSGFVGIGPTLAAIKASKRIALANKEVLVAAGSYVMELARQSGSEIIPVDSEHGAIFQCLQGSKSSEVERIILTASGGPFRTFPVEKLEQVTREQALCHPSWKMGPKITIDSSTLMNKGLEVIEAHFLFDLPEKKIDVVIHPPSIVHSFVEFCDGSMLAQLSQPDMKLPIQYALTYPDRLPGITPKFDFTQSFKLEFFPPDFTRFPCLALAYEALRQGGSMPCFLNAANEELVARLIQDNIRWIDLPKKLEQLMGKHSPVKISDYETIVAVDKEARALAQTI